MADETVYKRRRVSRACDRCRAIKAKCDGKQPICGRCLGYGHDCRWEKGRKGTLNAHVEPSDTESVQQIWRLNSKIHRLSTILQNVRDEVSEESRSTMDEELAAARTMSKSESVDGGASSPPSQQDEATGERFLGEASDIVFYNAVKQSLHVRSPASNSNFQESPGIAEASYEQHKPAQRPKYELSSIIPSRATADRYLDIYFSTIHIAYPFLSQKLVEEAHNEWWQKGSQSVFSQADIWLSLTLTIYAVGSCYECFSGADIDTLAREDRLHHRLFDQASAMLNRKEPRRHVDFVATTLVRCFYLLATSQTDRCWTALGVAVRTSQAIGLHMESPSSLKTRQMPEELLDRRRRTWYSVYVLDRLLALQLGRPPAIHDSFCNSALPIPPQEYKATSDSVDYSYEGEGPDGVEDYFTAMIMFSQLIGEVLEQLYGPHKTDLLQKTISNIQSCDQKLLQWRSSLPRRLRFDLGHTFDSSLMFKRQRNMLAIKFYHLRSLIYRPCVALSSHSTWASSPTETFSAERQSILLSKRLCISSAQSTSRLLYGLEGKQNLVHDFPWWQMISCLICASSILLVARLDIDHDELARHLKMEDVEEDAEVCLKVFAALSTNSNAARLARDMMRGLKESRLHSQERFRNEPSKAETPRQLPSSEFSLADTLPEAVQRLPDMTDPSTLQYWTSGMPVSGDHGYSNLPSYNEISEPLLWSAQFVNAEYNPFLNAGYEDVDLV